MNQTSKIRKCLDETIMVNVAMGDLKGKEKLV